jgi:hypothetical protein
VSWVLAIVLAPLALALLVLALPFHASARGAVADGELSWQVALGWAFWLVGVELGRGGGSLRLAGVRVLRFRRRRGRRASEHPARNADAEREREERRRSPGARLRTALAERGRLLRMAARFARALHLRLRVRGRVGAEDPADTAALAGVLRAFRGVPGIELEVEVDWMEEALDLEAEGSARAWAPELLTVAGLLFLRRENRVAVRALAG